MAHGVFSIDWESGKSARIGDIMAEDGKSVTRRLIRTTNPLSAGLMVRWNKFVRPGDPGSALGLDFTELHVPSPLGPLPAWYLSGPKATWIISVHGYRADRTESLRVLPILVRLGFQVLVTTYRNDAGAPRSPDGLSHLGDTEWEDIEAAVLHALRHGARDVVLFGFSMGGCIVETFLRRSPEAMRVSAVILDSPILNWHGVSRMAVRQRGLPLWSVPLFVRITEMCAHVDLSRLNYERTGRMVRPPTLVLHGTADQQVPVESSDAFARGQASVTYFRAEGADHTLIWNPNPDAYDREIAAFLERIAGLSDDQTTGL